MTGNTPLRQRTENIHNRDFNNLCFRPGSVRLKVRMGTTTSTNGTWVPNIDFISCIEQNNIKICILSFELYSGRPECSLMVTFRVHTNGPPVFGKKGNLLNNLISEEYFLLECDAV